MPRARLSAEGIEIAKPGKDVDSGNLADLIFSSKCVAMRLVESKVITVSGYDGYLNNAYERSVVWFPKPYPVPPIVLAAGIRSDGRSDQTQNCVTLVPLQSNWSYMLPHYCVETYTDRFELYVLTRSPITGAVVSGLTRTWRYFLFANTLT